MKFVWIWFPIVFKKSLSKISKVDIFSTGGRSEDGRHFILYKKTYINTYKICINTYGISYTIIYKSEINFQKNFHNGEH